MDVRASHPKASSSGDYNTMMQEVVGIRRSIQNINYRATCMSCVDNRTGKHCLECGVVDSSHNRQKRSVKDNKSCLSHRSLNSCNH